MREKLKASFKIINNSNTNTINNIELNYYILLLLLLAIYSTIYKSKY